MCMTAECQLGIALWKYLASPCRRIVLQHDNESLTVYTFQRGGYIAILGKMNAVAVVGHSGNYDGVVGAANGMVLVN